MADDFNLDDFDLDTELASLDFSDVHAQDRQAEEIAAMNAAGGEANPDLINTSNPVAQSIVLGAAKAGLEAKDLLTFGEPAVKSDARRFIEQRAEQLKRDSVVNGIAMSVAQFGVGFIGLGKIKYVARGAEWLADTVKGGRFIADTARGAAAGAIFMDPHEERLSNLVDQYPTLRNPITTYLAARPEDSAAEGRMKNALEGIVMDTALAGGLALVAKGLKYARAGDLKAANQSATEADALFAKVTGEDAAKPDMLQRSASGDTVPAQTGGGGDGVVSGEHLELNAPDSMAPSGGIGGSLHADSADGAAHRPGSDVPHSVDASAEAGQVTEQVASPRNHASAEHAAGELGANRAATDANASEGSRPGIAGDADGNHAAVSLDRHFPDAGRDGPLQYPHQVAEAALSPAQIDGLLTRARTDQDALLTYGSREAAADAGHVFAGSRETGIIPWQKLRTTDETRAWMGRLIDEQASYINTVRGGDAKGTLSDEAMVAMVAKRAAAWREDPAELMGSLAAAGERAPQLAANMETSFLIANRAYQDAYELAVRINGENYTGFGSRGEALAAFQQRMAMATAMYANGKAIVSNSARTLRRMRGEFRITDQQIANIQTADPESLKDLIAATGGNPRALADAGHISMVKRITDELAAFHAGNLLWGWKTQVVNFATSVAQLVWRPLEVNIGAAVLKRTVLRGDEAELLAADTLRRQSVREVTYLGSVLGDGWNAAVRAWIDGDSALVPHKQEAFNVVGTSGSSHLREIAPDYREIKTIDDLTHNALESWMTLKATTGLSLRTLGAADEMVKTMRYRAIVLAKASIEAEERGLARGSQDFNGFVGQRLDDAFDDLGRGTDREALEEAKASTFQQDLPTDDMTWIGSWSRSYSAGVAKAPLLRLITPFIKTPTNLMRYGVKLTPGLNLLQREYTHALSGKAGLEAQARATGQMTLGMMLAGVSLSLWANGSLVGSGPQNPQQRKQWLAQGNRPNSLTWTDDDGQRHFLELSRFDPINMPFLLIADAANIMTSGHLREEDEQGLAMSVTLALAHMVRDKTYLRGISDAVQAFTDDRKLSTFPQRFAPGFLPFSSLMASVNPDPLLHEARSVVDGLMAKIPGLSTTLPPQRDFLGDVVLAPAGFTSAQKNSGPLSRELDQMYAVTGTYLAPPAARGASTGGVDLRDFILKKSGRTAYDVYQELAGRPDPRGPSMRETLTNLVQTRDFKALPHGSSTVEGTRESVLTDVVMKFRQGAWHRMLAENDDLREAVYKQRIDTMKAVAEGRKSVRAAAAAPSIDRLNDFLKSYGIGEVPHVSVPQVNGN